MAIYDYFDKNIEIKAILYESSFYNIRYLYFIKKEKIYYYITKIYHLNRKEFSFYSGILNKNSALDEHGIPIFNDINIAKIILE